MEGIILLLIALAIWMFIGPFIAISAKGKSNELEESLKKLQNRINELEQELKETRLESSWKQPIAEEFKTKASGDDEYREALFSEVENQEEISEFEVAEVAIEAVEAQTESALMVATEDQSLEITNIDHSTISESGHAFLDDSNKVEQEQLVKEDGQPSLALDHISVEQYDNALLAEVIDYPIADHQADKVAVDDIDATLLAEISQEVQSSLGTTVPSIKPLAASPLATAKVSQPTKKVVVESRKPTPPEPSPIMTWITKGIQWFGQGNVPVKVGMLILLFGVGALLKYAVDQSWFTMTHALSAVGCAGVGAFIFAYMKRETHRVFSLTLQGGSIGVLLLTLFAASKIELLITSELAFILSFILIVITAVLSIRQNAIVLAAFAIFAGFMAPIWLSSGSNNYIGLFSYYVLLNIGIVIIAWFKPWQKLNLLGFAFTFIVGITWGVLKYDPANFSTTEPFLLIFFALYLIIPIFYANRMKDQRERMVDAILVFGNPLFALSIQCYLLDYARFPILLNTLGLALIYGGLAYAIRRLTDYRLLRVAYTALFWLFVMLAVPLAFAAEQTTIIYAFFAAIIFWWAEKTDDLYTKIIALIFHVLSIGAVLYSIGNGASFNELVPSFLSLAVTAFFIAYQSIKSGNKILEITLLLDGLFFWLLMGAVRIYHLDWNISFASGFSLFLGVTAFLFSSAYCVTARIIGQQSLYRIIAFVILAAGFMLPLYMVFGQGLLGSNYLVNRNLASWYLLLAMFWGILWQHRKSPLFYVLLSQLLFWAGGLVMLVYNCKFLTDILFSSSNVRGEWQWILISIPLLVMYVVRSFRAQWLIYPFKENHYVMMGEAFAVLMVGLLVVWLKLLTLAGENLLLPVWLPLVNAFDLTQFLIVGALIYYIWQHYAEKLIYIISGFTILMINVVIARAIHHWFGYSWGIDTVATREFFLACTLIYPLLTAMFVRLGNSEERKSFYPIALAAQGMILISALLLMVRYGFTGIDHWSFAIGGMINAIALLLSTYILYQREEEKLYRIFYIIGIAWWLLAGFIGLNQQFFGLNFASSILLFGIATGGAVSYLYKISSHRVSPQFIRELMITACASVSLGAIYLCAIVGERHLLGEGRYIVWLIYALVSYWILHNLRAVKAVEVAVTHIALLTMNLLVIMVELYYLLGLISTSESVRSLALTLPLTTVLLIALVRFSYLLFPLRENPLLPRVMLQRSLVVITGMSLIFSQLLSGVKLWGIWIPIANSVELLAYVYLAIIIKFARGLGWSDKKYQVITLTAICALISMTVVRACYHFVPLANWDLFMLGNETVQMALTIVWTMLGFALWIYGSKKRNQLIWRLGALLMGLVLLKLIVIDRTNLGNVMGIISFIGYGLFCLVIGYLAPQPPKEVNQQEIE